MIFYLNYYYFFIINLPLLLKFIFYPYLLLSSRTQFKQQTWWHRPVIRNKKTEGPCWEFYKILDICLNTVRAVFLEVQCNPLISTFYISTFFYIDMFSNSRIFPSLSSLKNFSYIDLFYLQFSYIDMFLAKYRT